MLSDIPALQPAFLHPVSNEPKQIVCVRVDGASDEGPSHDEVMFWWTVRHIDTAKQVSMMSSGSSYLNKVELQNGCLAHGHSNVFIPSTLNGSCLSEGGKVDKEKLQANLESAMAVYIARVDGSPCGDATINLFKGADSGEFQELRRDLLIFFKGI